MTDRSLVIAVDFDGTIVEHKYPEIGPVIPGSFEVLRELQEQGHKLILWTVRDGIDLKNAVDFCLENGLMFHAVNESHPNEEFNKYISRKINADIFIDDRNIGGFIGWDNIRQILLPDSQQNISEGTNDTETKKSFFQKLFGK
ncbi:MAG TPA: hypothetical protein PKN32_11595 [Bacteroidales bacterium]|nr:hypothetical protein [Bacteroidales bacterium]